MKILRLPFYLCFYQKKPESYKSFVVHCRFIDAVFGVFILHLERKFQLN